MNKEELKKIVQTIESGLKLEDDTLIFNVPVPVFEVYIRDNEYELSVKAQKMLLDDGKWDYFVEYVNMHPLANSVFKLALDKDEKYFAKCCYYGTLTYEHKKLAVSHKKALRWIELMMDNAYSETSQWLSKPELDVPFVKMEGAEADRVLKRYMVDNLPLSDEAQLALFEKKEAKKWVQYYHQVKGLSGKAWDMAKDKGWI